MSRIRIDHLNAHFGAFNIIIFFYGRMATKSERGYGKLIVRIKVTTERHLNDQIELRKQSQVYLFVASTFAFNSFHCSSTPLCIFSTIG